MKKVVGIVIGVIVVAFLAFRIVSGLISKPAAAQAAYLPVAVTTVQTEDIATTVVLSGKVQARSEISVAPKTPGRVAAIHVAVGDKVERGQVLFSLDKNDLQASYNQAQASLDLAQASYDLNKEKMDNAKAQLARMRALFEAGALSAADLEQVELAASDASIQMVEAQLAQARAGFQTMANTMNDLDVKAPAAGIVTSLNLQVGNMVSNAAAAAVIVDMDRVYVTVGVSEKVINYIKNGQEVQVEIASSGKNTLTGSVQDLSLAADARTGLYGLKVYMDNADGAIKPGMFAKVSISTETKKNVFTAVPEAIILSEGQYVVYVAEGDKAVKRSVALGLDNGKKVEIVSGLSAGDLLIVRGQEYIKEGLPIKVVEKDGVSQSSNSGSNGNDGNDGSNGSDNNAESSAGAAASPNSAVNPDSDAGLRVAADSVPEGGAR